MNTMGKIRKMVNRRIVWVKATDLDQNRIRFNWGYHDGALDVRTGFERKDDLNKHYDQVYVRGYRAGAEDMRQATYFGDSVKASFVNMVVLLSVFRVSVRLDALLDPR